MKEEDDEEEDWSFIIVLAELQNGLGQFLHVGEALNRGLALLASETRIMSLRDDFFISKHRLKRFGADLIRCLRKNQK